MGIREQRVCLGTAYVFIAEFFEQEFKDACELFPVFQTCKKNRGYIMTLLKKKDGVESLTISYSPEQVFDFIVIHYEGMSLLSLFEFGWF